MRALKTKWFTRFEEEALKDIAAGWLKATPADLARQIAQGLVKEIEYDARNEDAEPADEGPA